MLTGIKHITLLFLAGWMTLASGGLSVFEHHCNCTGEENISLLKQNTCSTEPHEDIQSMASDCCSSEESSAANCPQDKKGNCCETHPLAFLKTSDFTNTLSGDTRKIQADQETTDSPSVLRIDLVQANLGHYAEIAFKYPPPRKVVLLFTGAYHSALTF